MSLMCPMNANQPAQPQSIEQLQEEIKRETLLRELHALRQDRQQRDGAPSGSIVRLNVGGQEFATTKQTLTAVPGSMLAAMFSGDFSPGALDECGRYFLDSDPKHFDIILEYLRTQVVPEASAELIAQAQYFGLGQLAEELRQQSEVTYDYAVGQMDWTPSADSFVFWRALPDLLSASTTPMPLDAIAETISKLGKEAKAQLSQGLRECEGKNWLLIRAESKPHAGSRVGTHTFLFRRPTNQAQASSLKSTPS
eukprot:TRINITY_DN12179_c0_g1_i3.p1 TRINITY_DN12179_c0_g1~~TRINITY_DN12179_c0_g1_i3.p1  ORF type:complete len:253 (-),score=41.95 TRINITY_DN12179_c0_g1_i3:157-915(-)